MRFLKLIPHLHRFFERPVTELDLTQWERQIFNFLCRAATAAKHDPPIELRVAGGWVRDKLLNRPTGDIDIAIRHASGFQFAQHVKSYADTHKTIMSSRSFIGPPEYIPHDCSATCIEPNPENSRHLETAAVILDDHTMDFVQLRTEDYIHTANSRVPSTVSPATPKEDAMRRDFTVNALFYNLHTWSVEDWTTQGLRDLHNSLLRTPLNPSVTMQEDPLRALRAIRFACKLGFEIHPSIQSVLCNPDIHHAMARKVSRERIGHEIMQIVQSPRMIEGLCQLADFGLAQVVFGNSFGETSARAAECLQERIVKIRQVQTIWADGSNLLSEDEQESFNEHQRTVLIFAVLAEELSHIRPVLVESLRRTKHLERDVYSIMTVSQRLEELINKRGDNVSFGTDTDDETWIDIAKELRKAGESLLIAAMIYCSVRLNRNDLFPRLVQLGFNTRVCQVTPALDGYVLQQKLGLKKGPEVGRAIQELIRLQLLQVRHEWQHMHGKDVKTSVNPLQSTDALIEALKDRLSLTTNN